MTEKECTFGDFCRFFKQLQLHFKIQNKARDIPTYGGRAKAKSIVADNTNMMRESSTRSYLVSICCGVLGYIIGSMPSTTTNSLLKGQVDIKFSHQPIEYDTDTLMEEMLKEIDAVDYDYEPVVLLFNNSINESTAMPNHLPTKKSLIEEIVPPKLQPVYEKLQFNVTRSMLRQSRPIIGNTQRLHSYLKKLRNKECTTVLFLGGSGEFAHAYTYIMPFGGTIFDFPL